MNTNEGLKLDIKLQRVYLIAKIVLVCLICIQLFLGELFTVYIKQEGVWSTKRDNQNETFYLDIKNRQY